MLLGDQNKNIIYKSYHSMSIIIKNYLFVFLQQNTEHSNTAFPFKSKWGTEDTMGGTAT